MIAVENTKIGFQTPLFSIESLHLKSGKMYALIGSNGSGKTTFLKSLIGLIEPISGKILVKEKSIFSLQRSERAKTIAFVNSKFDGVDFLRVRDYIALGRTPYTNALGRLSSADWKIVDDTIELLELGIYANKYTTELSDGERQLSAIAMAVAQQTEIIILDEPTAFLDYANRIKIITLMQKITQEMNKCVIVSSHDLELCLESKIDLLVIEKKSKKLSHFQSNQLTKEKLIEIGFG